MHKCPQCGYAGEGEKPEAEASDPAVDEAVLKQLIAMMEGRTGGALPGEPDEELA